MSSVLKQSDPIPHLRPGKRTSYSPADIKRWGSQRFLDEVCETSPIQIPNLEFTEQENKMMEQVLKQEKLASDNGF